MIDLHTHSTCSDGTLRPAELARKAAREGVRILALTDHDTTSGLGEFLEAAGACGLSAVPGVEISARHPDATLHLLGHFIRPGHAALETALAGIRDGRKARNARILENLAGLGLPLDPGAVRSQAGGDVVGRPHIARAMVARGYVPDTGKAFAKYLARGRPAYAERYRPEPEEAVRWIREAGGAASLAHPGQMRLHAKDLEALLKRLAAAGLAGLEVFHPEHTAAQRKRFGELAARRGLVPIGGSDFHGGAEPGRRPGYDRAEPLGVPPDAVDRLRILATAACGPAGPGRDTVSSPSPASGNSPGPGAGPQDSAPRG